MFATYARPTNKGNIFVKVTGEKTKEVYVNQTVNVKDVQDNAYHTFEFEKEIDPKDERIVVEVSSDSKENQGIAAYYANINELKMALSISIIN